MLFLIVALSAMLIFIIINSLFIFISKGNLDIDERMQRYTNIAKKTRTTVSGLAVNESSDKGNSLKFIKPLILIVRFLGAKFKKVPQAKDFDIKMQQAGIALLGSEFLVVLVGTALFAFAITLIVDGNIMHALLFAISTAIMIIIYINIKISKRRHAFNNQLGDALVMMANSMRSGFSFMQAVDMVANEMSSPIANEFAKLVAEMRLGIPSDEALTNLSKRIGSKDFDLVIIAVMIHRQVGGNLAQILESISSTITERIRMKREITTLTSQGRMSGWIVGLLPFGMAMILEVVNPNYLTPLYTEELGTIMIGIGLGLQVVGMVVLRKIVDIDV